MLISEHKNLRDLRDLRAYIHAEFFLSHADSADDKIMHDALSR